MEQAAVYVAWGTMRNAIESFVQGVHNRIDRTAFPGLSGGTQSQLLAGLKFLGLITGDGTPTPALHGLAVPDEAARKKKLEAILRDRYGDLFTLDLLKTTPALLEEKMGESYNVSGSTRDRAVRFFLYAVEYLGIPVSPLLKKAAGNGTPAPRKRRAAAKTKPESEPTPLDILGVPPTGGTARVVKLKSGGMLTVSASLDLFSLIPSDRKFVFELIDKLEEYERTAEA
jgi:hypothetical protein